MAGKNRPRRHPKYHAPQRRHGRRHESPRICDYHLHEGRVDRSFRCRYCKKLFCSEHIKAKPPGKPDFNASSPTAQKLLAEFHERGGHPCPEYFDVATQRIEDENNKYHDAFNNLINSGGRHGSHSEPSYEQPQSQSNWAGGRDIPEHQHGGRRSFRSPRLPKISSHRWNRMKTRNKIMVSSFVVAVVLNVVASLLKSEPLNMISWLLLYITEVTVIYALMMRADHMRADSDMRIWLLRIVSGLFILFGAGFMFVFIMSSVFTGSVYGMYFGLIGGFGMFIIGAYLEFKFMRRSGSIVYVR